MKLILIISSFIVGIEYQKINTCNGNYDFDYGVCRVHKVINE